MQWHKCTRNPAPINVQVLFCSERGDVTIKTFKKEEKIKGYWCSIPKTPVKHILDKLFEES